MCRGNLRVLRLEQSVLLLALPCPATRLLLWDLHVTQESSQGKDGPGSKNSISGASVLLLLCISVLLTSRPCGGCCRAIMSGDTVFCLLFSQKENT